MREYPPAKTSKGRPFFLYYAPMAVHAKLEPPPTKYSAPFHTGIKYSGVLYGHLRVLDEGIREIFDLLKTYDQDQNTVFILTADITAILDWLKLSF
jgi:arylsulfatase A-like enzyme